MSSGPGKGQCCSGVAGPGSCALGLGDSLGVAGVWSAGARVPGSPSGVAAGLDSQGLQPAAEALRKASDWLHGKKEERFGVRWQEI